MSNSHKIHVNEPPGHDWSVFICINRQYRNHKG